MQLLLILLLAAPCFCISYEKLLHAPPGYRSIVKQQLQGSRSIKAASNPQFTKRDSFPSSKEMRKMSDKKTGKYKLETENKEQEFWDEIQKTGDIDQQKMNITEVERKKGKPIKSEIKNAAFKETEILSQTLIF